MLFQCNIGSTSRLTVSTVLSMYIQLAVLTLTISTVLLMQCCVNSNRLTVSTVLLMQFRANINRLTVSTVRSMYTTCRVNINRLTISTVLLMWYRVKSTYSMAKHPSFNRATHSGPEEDYRHFYPELQPGSDHPSDNEWVDPPAYESDEDLELPESDNSLYANINQDRLHRPVEEWCSCGECKPMDTEKEHVCCNESHFITAHRGEHRCISQVGMFEELVVSEDGLVYSRYLVHVFNEHYRP